MDDRTRIRQLEDEVQRLKRRLDQRPPLFTVRSVQPYMVLTIDQGNTLETGQDGIVYETSVPTVPSAYDPDVSTSFIDGIGRGTLHIDGVAQPGYVLIVNDDRGTFQNALLQDDKIFTQGPVSIPVDGGGSVRAYVAG